MNSKDILNYEAVKKDFIKKGREIVLTKFPERHICSNHEVIIEELGVYFQTHDGLYMQGAVLVTWEELGI